MDFLLCPFKVMDRFPMIEWHFFVREMGVLTLSVLYVQLVYLLSELVLLNGLSARNRKRETPLKVLHLVHGVEEQTLGEERDTETDQSMQTIHASTQSLILQ